MKTFPEGLQIAIAATTLGFTIGCGSEDVDSSAIRTAGMYADYSAVATGNGNTTVTAQLRVGGDDGTIVKLTAGDSLALMVGDESSILGAIDNRERYRTTATTDEPNAEFVLAFERAEDQSAPNSIARLPPPFVMTLPDLSEAAELERGMNLAVTWEGDAGSGEISWRIEGDCIWSESGTAPDSGSLTIPASDVRVKSLDEGESCSATLSLERDALGTVDPAFEEGGRFVTIQRRQVSFLSTPAPNELQSDDATAGSAGD